MNSCAQVGYITLARITENSTKGAVASGECVIPLVLSFCSKKIEATDRPVV